jgi:hypothetical protein
MQSHNGGLFVTWHAQDCLTLRVVCLGLAVLLGGVFSMGSFQLVQSTGGSPLACSVCLGNSLTRSSSIAFV